MIFLDSNIFLRFFLRDDEAKAEQCKDLLLAIATGEQEAMTSTMVIAEVVWVLERTYRCSRKQVAEFVMSLLGLSHLVLREKHIVEIAISCYAKQNIDFIDAYNAALMSAEGLQIIYTYDRHFAQLPSVESREP